MKSNFKILFSLSMQHNFYVGNLSSDFSIEVAKSSLEMLRNHGMGVKIFPESAIVYFDSTGNSNQPKVPFHKFVPITFYLRLKNSDFFAKTNIPAHKQYSFYFSNFDLNGNERPPAANSTKVALQDIDNYIQVAPQGPESDVSAESGSVEIRPFSPLKGFSNGISFPVNGPTTRVKFPQPGLFQVASTPTLANPLRFIDQAAVQNKPFAIVQIWKGPDTDYSKTVDYAVPWERAQNPWLYFITGDDADQIENLSLVLGGKPTQPYPGGLVFQAQGYDDLNLTEKALADYHGKDRSAFFRSSVPIPRFEKPLGAVELRKEGIKIGSLPNLSNKALDNNIFFKIKNTQP
jgi:hypothetical protein